MDDVENLLIPQDSDICAMTHITPQGREFICIREKHSPVYYNRTTVVYQHHMVNRWPYRKYAPADIKENN